MKKLLLLSLMIASAGSYSYASGTLKCTAEDGSELQAVVNNEEGSVPTQFKLRVREGTLNDYPNAYAKYYESGKKFYNGHAQTEKIKLLVVQDPSDGVIAIIKNGNTLMDRTGVYSADCEFGY